MTLRAIADHVIFVFEDSMRRKTIDPKTEKKLFVEKTSWGFETVSPDETIGKARWGISVAVGPLCDTEIQPGMRILIEPLQWTNGVQVGDDWFWRTNDKSIMAIDEDFKIEKSKKKV